MGSWPEWERVITNSVYYGLFTFLAFWILNRRSDKDGGRQNLLTLIATLYRGNQLWSERDISFADMALAAFDGQCSHPRIVPRRCSDVSP